MKAIIVGTEIENCHLLKELNKYENPVFHYCDEENGLIYLPRHGKNHENSPSSINYIKNTSFLLERGVNEVITLYSVGSISASFPPLSFFRIDDFIDFCSSISFFNDEIVHTDFSSPFSLVLRKKQENIINLNSAVYFTTLGPRLETKSEIRAIKALGADVVGMTLGKEAVVLKEAGIMNLALGLSINWASGLEDKISFPFSSEVQERTKVLLELSKKILLS